MKHHGIRNRHSAAMHERLLRGGTNGRLFIIISILPFCKEIKLKNMLIQKYLELVKQSCMMLIWIRDPNTLYASNHTPNVYHCHSTHICIWRANWREDVCYDSLQSLETCCMIKTCSEIMTVCGTPNWMKNICMTFLITVLTKINNCQPLPCGGWRNHIWKQIYWACQYTALFCITVHAPQTMGKYWA